MEKRNKRILLIVITSIAVVTIAAVVVWKLYPTDSRSNAAFDSWFPSSAAQPIDRSNFSQPVEAEMESLEEFTEILRPMLERLDVRKKELIVKLEQTKDVKVRDSLFRANRFADMLGVDALNIKYIDGELYQFVDQMTFSPDKHYALELESAAKMLDGNGFMLIFNNPGNEGPGNAIEVNVIKEYHFFEKYISPSYRKFMQNLILEQQGGSVFFDAYVALPLDSLFVRLDRWGGCLKDFARNDPYGQQVKNFVEFYAELSMFCKMDNSRTFSFNDLTISPTVYDDIKRVAGDSLIIGKEVEKIVAKYLEMLEKNNKVYSEEFERSINSFVMKLYDR